LEQVTKDGRLVSSQAENTFHDNCTKYLSTVTPYLPHFFYLEYGLCFACGLYEQRTQRDKVLLSAIALTKQDEIIWRDVRYDTHDTEEDTDDDLP